MAKLNTTYGTADTERGYIRVQYDDEKEGLALQSVGRIEAVDGCS